MAKFDLQKITDWGANHLNPLMQRNSKLLHIHKMKESHSSHTSKWNPTIRKSTPSKIRTLASIRQHNQIERAPIQYEERVPSIASYDDESSWGNSPEFRRDNLSQHQVVETRSERLARRQRLVQTNNSSWGRVRRETRTDEESSESEKSFDTDTGESGGESESDSGDNVGSEKEDKKRASERIGTKPKSKAKEISNPLDVMDEVASPSRTSIKPWGRYSGMRTVPIGTHIDRSWIMIDTPQEQRYIPQIGDKVFYFGQGHKEYLRSFPENSSPPWLAFTRPWPVVECIVLSVAYDFPTFSEYKRCHSILIHLRYLSNSSRKYIYGHY